MFTTPACDYCRYRKRKCDRQAPKCSMCILKNRSCRYSDQTQWDVLDRQAQLDYSVIGRGMGQTPAAISSPKSSFPAVYFLDHDVFESSRIGLPPVELQLNSAVMDAFDMASTTSARYFSWVHLWMPIVSISKWRTQLTGPLARPRADVKILLFAMKLILWTPQDSESGEPRTDDYFILKDLFLQAEAAGMLSLQLLQALILLTIYEYSHAIYPAAYLSIGTCVRYGLGLGIDKQRQVEIDAANFGLDEQEERRRVWWATIILDRMVSWSSTSPEPRSDDLLPVHDQHWDEGKIDRSRINPVSAPSNTNMGMLARLAQSAFLLGRVYRWKNCPTGDAKFDEEEKDQLDRALRALLNLIYQEGATRLMPVCPQTALCFSALVTLHSQPGNATPFMSHADHAAPMRYLTDSQTQNRLSALVETLQFLRPIAEESSVSTALFFRKEPWSIEKSSPLLIHWTYLIAVTFIRLKISLDRDEAQISLFNVSPVVPALELLKQADQGLEAMKMKLSLLGKQWLAAGAYLRILQAREVGNML